MVKSEKSRWRWGCLVAVGALAVQALYAQRGAPQPSRPDNAQSLSHIDAARRLEAQLRALRLDPANVKFILLGHGHADHFGGAKFFQNKYGTKVAASAADWELINPSSAPAAAPGRGGGAATPARDVVLAEG